MGPDVEAGAVADTELKLALLCEAVTPLNVMAREPALRFAPVIVTIVPDGPKPGEKPEKVCCTVKSPEEEIEPAGVTMLIWPVNAPTGTVAVICVLESTVNDVALIPPNVTEEASRKFVP